jgi:23S rRNA (guanosine2251-2'-O)-methyltransferase
VAIGGRRPVTEALAAERVKTLLLAQGSLRPDDRGPDHQGREPAGSGSLRELIAEAERRGVTVEWVERASLDRLAPGNNQGIAAIVDLPEELSERELTSLLSGDRALVVVLDGVTDPQNFGAAGRSAEAAGAAALILRSRRAAPFTPAAVRASAGALLHLPVVRVVNLTRALDRLKDLGFFVVGLDHRAEVDVHLAPDPGPRLALVVGAEGEGISRLVREACDLLVSLPMRGQISSLNVSAALAAGLFAYALRPRPDRVTSPTPNGEGHSSHQPNAHGSR